MTVFIADVHVDNFAQFSGPERGGLNDRGRYVLQSLEDAFVEAGNEDVVILGDLFNRCQPSPVLISHVQSIITAHPGTTWVLLGNHDQESGAFGHNALAPLAPVCHVVETPLVVHQAIEAELWFAPFKPGPAKDWLPETLEQLSDLAAKGASVTQRALCVHMGLSDSKTPYYLDQTSGSMAVRTLAKICKKHGITHVFAGDWHRHQRWKASGVELVQVGALCPPRFPPGYEHGDRGPLVRWSGRSGRLVTVEDIPGPRFVKLRFSQVKDKQWIPPQNSRPCFLRLTCRSDQVDAAKEWLASLKVELGLLEQGGLLGAAELDVDRGLERAKARTASFEARAASSLDEAIALYIKNMPVEAVVDRDNVLQHVRRLLGKRA